MRPEVAKAIHYIKQHLQDELSLHTLSQVTQISPTYLSRLFKKDIGLSIIDYISEQRINQAKQYFMEGSYRNHELAEMVGFHNYSYFCTMFKKMTGMTPNEYKNSVRTIR
jgi:YesN/AraC family two-component response regulator